MASKDKQAQSSGPNPKKGRRYSPGEKAAILKSADEDGPASAAREHGCTEWTIRRWRKQCKRAAERQAAQQASDLTDADSAHSGEGDESADEPSELSPEQQARHDRVLKIWRTNPGFGPSQVRNQLRRENYRVSVHTVRDIMEEHGYISPKVRPKEPAEEYEVVRPMELYHLDFGHFYCHKQSVCFLLIEDDFSRFLTGWILLASEHADGVIEALDASVLRYGKPEAVMIDRGSAFYSFRGVHRFERRVTEDGIDYYPIDEPRKNGKVERAVSTVKKELITQVEFADLQDAQLRFAAWVRRYNYTRTHQALRGGLLVPADRFHGLEEDVLQRLEHGDGRSPFDLLASPGRPLDILRVCSVSGQATVYLLGKKILG